MAILLMLCISLGACGITAPQRDAGFADVDSLDWREVDQNFSLSLGPTLLGLAASVIEDDPQTEKLLRSLYGVRVKAYRVEPGEAEAVSLDLNNMSQDLIEQDWEPVVLVREQGESTHMLVKMEGERIRGLALLTSDGEEAVFVNVMGDLQPELFNQAIAALKVPAPEVDVVQEQPANQDAHPGEAEPVLAGRQ
ncbi:MAG: DUF4252 domain-containing protein [Halioglobus sp.]